MAKKNGNHGGGDEFPSTHTNIKDLLCELNNVACIPREIPGKKQVEIERELFDIFERPMQSYIRALVYRYSRGSQAEELASELMQDFADHALNNCVFQKWDPRKGGLRAYLKTCIRNRNTDAFRQEIAASKGIAEGCGNMSILISL